MVTDKLVLKKGKKQSIVELVNIDKEFGSGCCQILVKFLFEQFLSLGKHAAAIAFVIWLFEKFHLTDFT